MEAARSTEEAGYAKFVEQHDQALAIVVLSVDLSLLYLIGQPTDPKEVWIKLKEQKRPGRTSWSSEGSYTH